MANARVLIVPVLLSVLHSSEFSVTMSSKQIMIHTDDDDNEEIKEKMKLFGLFSGAGLDCYSCSRGGQDCQNG